MIIIEILFTPVVYSNSLFNMAYTASYGLKDDDEQESIQNLLACSTRNDAHEKKVLIGSWDEVFIC